MKTFQYAGQATIYAPPNSQGFNVNNKQPSISLPSLIKPPTKHANTSANTDINTNVGDLLMVTQLLGHIASIATINMSTPLRNPLPSTPTCPTRSAAPTEPQSSPVPHDSNIKNFLKYAEQKLGVAGTQRHEPLMTVKCYVPDILI